MKERETRRVVTTEARLKTSPLTEELDRRLKSQEEIVLFVYRALIDPGFYDKYESLSKFRSHVSDRFNILTRDAYSIIHEVQGRLKALEELKKTQRKALTLKIGALERKRDLLKKRIEALKTRHREGKATARTRRDLRNKKQSLYFLNNKINKKKQSLENLNKEISEKSYRIGLGGRKNFRKQYRLKENGFKSHEEWYDYYKAKKTHSFFFLGVKAEKAGSQLARLEIDEENGTLRLRLRERERDKRAYLYQDNIILKYYKEEVYSVVRGEAEKPLSLRFLKRGKKWYLQMIFDRELPPADTTAFYGTIGLDYNNGFIQSAETDQCGNLTGLKKYSLRSHGTGNRAKNEIREVAKQIAEDARSKGKDVIIEDLDFKDLKARSLSKETGYERKRNRDLHLFDYHRYMETVERACLFRGVNVKRVPPYYSSKNGFEKYSQKKKLNIHQSASFVIARRGQGLRD